MLIFGISTILSGFKINLLPSLGLCTTSILKNVFFQAMILTISNPLTIVFWAAVFSAKIAEEDMVRNEMILYGLGALASTVISLMIVSLIGIFSRTFLPGFVVQLMNIVVGGVLLYFGVRMILQKGEK